MMKYLPVIVLSLAMVMSLISLNDAYTDQKITILSCETSTEYWFESKHSAKDLSAKKAEYRRSFIISGIGSQVAQLKETSPSFESKFNLLFKDMTTYYYRGNNGASQITLIINTKFRRVLWLGGTDWVNSEQFGGELMTAECK